MSGIHTLLQDRGFYTDLKPGGRVIAHTWEEWATCAVLQGLVETGNLWFLGVLPRIVPILVPHFPKLDPGLGKVDCLAW